MCAKNIILVHYKMDAVGKRKGVEQTVPDKYDNT